MTSSSTTSIMSIRDMIDIAFGDSEVNIVNHKLIQTILYLLARQLRVLERRVQIVIVPDMEMESSSSLSVTEVKLHAQVPKKKRRLAKMVSSVAGGKVGSISTAGLVSKAILNKGTRGQIDSKRQRDKTLQGSDKPLTSDKSASDKSGTDKSSIEKSFPEKYSVEKSSTIKTFADKTSIKMSTTKSSNLRAPLNENLTESSTKSTTDSSTRDKTTNITAATDRTISDKISKDKMSTDNSKTSSGKSKSDKSSTDKYYTDKSSNKSTEDSNIEKLLSDKRSDKWSSEQRSTEKPSNKISTQKSSSKDTTISSDKDYHKLMEKIEERREKELRVIHQRADSREVQERTPTPMASLDIMEMQYEKLLIVQRVPTEEAKIINARYGTDSRGRTPQLSIVTQEEFAELATIVRELQDRFGPIAGAEFPDNIKLMQDLRKGASLTDAMAALQLSARLEGAEKTLQKMTSLVTDLASRTPGFEGLLDETHDVEAETEVLFGAPKILSQISPSRIKKYTVQPTEHLSKSTAQYNSVPSTESLVPTVTSYSHPKEYVATEVPTEDKITAQELEIALQRIYDDFLKMVTSSTTRSNVNSDNALKMARGLEEKLNASLNLGNRMNDLETLVSEYSEQINFLDTGLSSQMTNYQELLTQMQHDLETGLETMAEALANTGGDTTAVAELNTHFTNLQIDLDTTNLRQKELRDVQTVLSKNLQDIWKQIELLQAAKSDRDEVADALKDKAGLEALNGLVTLQQFDAVRGDLEKRISNAYDKFNNQEIIWQKAIDELVRELNEKADWIQVVSLRDDVNKNLEKLRSRLHAMIEIVGEPQAAAVSRRLHRETACLSCASPAHMNLEEPGIVPALPAFKISRPPAVGAEAPTKMKEDGAHKLCYPGLPIPHPRDPRSHVCQRYCGGSHTILSNTTCRAPLGLIVNPALRQVTTGVGSCGKTYITDEEYIKKPCVPCNVPKPVTPDHSIVEQGPLPTKDVDSDTSPTGFQEQSQVFVQLFDDVSITPPPPFDDD